jgi:hypothetical protein
MRQDFDPDHDYYEVLQVHQRASQEVIKHAYRAIVRELQVHPDLGGSHQQAVLVNRAYEVLSDPNLRTEYDTWRTSMFPGRRVSDRSAFKVVTCPSCRKKNRLPQRASLASARCGSCRAPLVGSRIHPEPPTRATPSRPAPSTSAVVENHLKLSPSLYRELHRDGELRLRSQRASRTGRCLCRRCHHDWKVAPNRPPPRRCPKCGSTKWNWFRVFKCTHCGYEFVSNNLNTWPYRLYPRCPSCLLPNWSARCERDPWKWLKGLWPGSG